MKQLLFLVLMAAPTWAQVNQGELRLKVVDPSGAALHATAHLVCVGNGYDRSFAADNSGRVAMEALPYGDYRLEVRQSGFAAYTSNIEIHSALPLVETVRLSVAPVVTQVNVRADTLIDPEHSSSAMRIGSEQIEQRTASLPGRSLQNLVISQPGWLYEGNAVLHPRGSEYQTQFVVDGIPLTDNRSPSFGPEIEAEDLDAMTIYTAGFPAEYGRKMGGVVELDTHRPVDPGMHGRLVLGGGSYNTGTAYGELMDVWGRNSAGVSAAGSTTSHYLNPVVPQNFTNTGTTGDFSARYERDFTEKDRMTLSLRHELSRYLIPNELIQEQAGQIQSGNNFETMGIAHYQHIVSADTLIAVAGMVRDHASGLNSNADSTPILAYQNNSFREGYFKATVSQHHGRHELKAGVESDAMFLHEHFNYTLSDPAYFDSSTPPSLSFAAARPDLEQSGFVEDEMHAGNWSVSAGLRWDHYQLLLNRNALSPRVAVGRYFPALNLSIHGSYDRIFQTPSFDNILISSSSQIDALDSDFLRLPVQPSHGNYYEGGITESIFGRMRADVNVYRRDVRQCADDDQLLNTGVSYPIAFSKCVVYGAESKLTLVELGKFSGFASYSYMVGNAWFPVTGGLFLGDDADAAVAQAAGHFPDTQDQRNTLSTRWQYRVKPRLWFAAGALYGSGLPFEFQGTEQQALAEYGPAVIAQIDFARGRVRPQLSLDSSLGMDLYEGSKLNLHLQGDAENLENRLNVIDFGGLFSGNAIGPGRTFAVRLNTSF